MNFRCLHDNVIIRPLPPILTKGGLHLPENQEWLDRDKGQAIEGVVLMVGLGDKIGTAGAMKVNSRPVGRIEWYSRPQELRVFGSPTCLRCGSSAPPAFRIKSNDYRCLCGQHSILEASFHPELAMVHGSKSAQVVAFEGRLFELTDDAEWCEIDIRSRRAPMFLKAGDHVLFFPTAHRLKDVEIDGETVRAYVVHEEQLPLAVLRDGKWCPLYDRILVKDLDAPDMSAGGIAIPRTAKRYSHQGRVLAVGNGKRLEGGKMAPLDMRIGETVVFADNAGSEVRINNESYIIMREDEVLGVLDGKAVAA